MNNLINKAHNANDNFTGKLFVIFGPSGAGKTTLLADAVKKLSSQFALSQVVTYTCRAPRANEVNGKDYCFISPEEFQEKKSQNFFLESNDFIQRSYGSPRSIIDELENGTNLAIILDRTGAIFAKKNIKKVVLIGISVSLAQLELRMKVRNIESEEYIAKRLAYAQKEIAQEVAEPISDYTIINEKYEQSLDQLMFIMTKELLAEK